MNVMDTSLMGMNDVHCTLATSSSLNKHSHIQKRGAISLAYVHKCLNVVVIVFCKSEN